MSGLVIDLQSPKVLEQLVRPARSTPPNLPQPVKILPGKLASLRLNRQVCNNTPKRMALTVSFLISKAFKHHKSTFRLLDQFQRLGQLHMSF